MTAALCLACGEMKFGAWVDCPSCGFEPSPARLHMRMLDVAYMSSMSPVTGATVAADGSYLTS
jgi:hypothetical protein